MGECLHYEANVIKAEYKFGKYKPSYATKKTQSMFTMGLLWALSLSAFCPLNKVSSFLSQGLWTCCIF